MSKIYIPGVLTKIKNTNIYSCLVEAIVNSIDAIPDSEKAKGEIRINLLREDTIDISDGKSDVTSVEVIDNGVGFNTDNRDSFDTFYSPKKKDLGGKGFGRFLFPKYFSQVKVESVYETEKGEYELRTFNFGREYDIIINEKKVPSEKRETYTKLTLKNVHSNQLDKQLNTISRRLLEKLLIFFINEDFQCPQIIVVDKSDNQEINLSDYLTTTKEIVLFKNMEFEVDRADSDKKEKFRGKVFKIYYPGNQRSKISLTGHNREVTEAPLHNYIPEFEDEFYDEFNGVKRNYIIKTYVIGDYLDKHVSLEREEFDFHKKGKDLMFPISQQEIELSACEATRICFENDVQVRLDKKITKIRDYINEEAPWHKSYYNDLDLSKIPFNADPERIEMELQKVKFNKEIDTRQKFKQLMSSSDSDFDDNIESALEQISEIGKSDLAHYVYSRKIVLQTLEELLKRRSDGKGELEKEVHQLIFPMNADTEEVNYKDHNLWLLDERLVFSEYVASDRKLSTKQNSLGEPDLVVFDKKRSFRRGDNEYSNPLTIFEFKRPKRDDYSAKDDPIKQIGRYLDEIREGKYDMPEGLESIKVNDSTPVYAIIVADLTKGIREFARDAQLTISPDNEGFFGFHAGYKMYVEIMSFSKLLKDANLRNRIFFNKLQIE